ncbi:hypothetical protein HY405_01545 [Candidatus Microgenomates bacterium]|nr:hypothetical protein [Candidatus Microgenomates bacterium]
MRVVTDLHSHSKYSRAVSPQMVLPTISEWAQLKGIDVVGTGDFTHPLWLKELEAQLEEAAPGLYALKKWEVGGGKLDSEMGSGKSHLSPRSEVSPDSHITPHISPLFLLSTEVAAIYSQGGKGRRIHLLLFVPSFAAVEKINKELTRRGANLFSDGRPILGMSARDVAQIVFEADPRCLVVPAHCLPPNEFIHTKEGVKQIKDIQLGEFVYTHNNRSRAVTEVFRREFEGDLCHIKPWYFSMGLKVTPEHPFYAFKVVYCPSAGDRCLPTRAHKKVCRNKFYEQYKPTWIPAEKLEIGDVLVFPRFQNTTPQPTISLASFSYKTTKDKVFTGGARGRVFAKEVSITKEFCRLLGYYLAEGYTNGRDEIGFTFHQSEGEYVRDVAILMRDVFGISYNRLYRRKGSKSIEISFYSKLLVHFFTRTFYTRAPFKATTKIVPQWMLHLPTELQADLLRGWWRGDGGYTSSRDLMNAMKVICLRLGIIPSILQDSKERHFQRGNHRYKGRIIKASSDSYVFAGLAFFEDPYNLLADSAFKASIRKLKRKHGWIDKHYIYMPIRSIEKIPYKGEVFNLEVEEDNSYVTEFTTVHNCWTPWFSLYGSMSGFDSIEECFGDMSRYIYGIETGLSSDPAMNWRVSDLDNRAILSFSDAHSPAKLGREATVFELPEMSYEGIREAIIGKWEVRGGRLDIEVGSEKSKIPLPSEANPLSHIQPHISYTIEFYPEEGKYHFTGHRDCSVRHSPEETKRLGTTCPVCKRGLTIGVMHRVEELARKSLIINHQSLVDEYGVRWVKDSNGRPHYTMMVPLMEILAEAIKSLVTSQRTINEYKKLTELVGNEFFVLLQTKPEEIERVSGELVREAIEKVRGGDIVIEPGYDGVFGKVKIWSEKGEAKKGEQTELF